MKTAVKTSPVNMAERKDLGIRSGDTVRVWQNIVELKSAKAANKKEVTTKNVRRQAFEGLVLAVKHGHEAGATFTVRKVSGGIGVEKIFPLYSPMIDSVEVLRRTRVRRSKLYFIRDKASREAKRAMRRQLGVEPSKKQLAEEAAEEASAEAEAPQEAAATTQE